jgi:DNA-binding CsgD family transcriptional regulator
MNELQRVSPALWGLAEAAIVEGRAADAIALTAEAAARSAEVADAAYLFPHVVTGTRARLAAGSIGEARAWLDETGALLRRRGIPGTMPALEHAAGLVALAERRTSDARELLEQAQAEWDVRRRFWEGTGVRLHLARVARRARRPGEEAALLAEVRERAAAARAPLFARLAGEQAARADPSDAAAGPLTPRERQSARLVALGATNREIAERLVIAPKTVSSHVEHILAKLGMARRAEVAAWIARTQPAVD